MAAALSFLSSMNKEVELLLRARAWHNDNRDELDPKVETDIFTIIVLLTPLPAVPARSSLRSFILR